MCPAPPETQLAEPMPPTPPQQTWAHSCCLREKLEEALANPAITAIESDIMMSTSAPAPSAAAASGGSDYGGCVPIMAHPSLLGHAPLWDLTFADFLSRCVSDGKRHLKFDFKELRVVEPCLRMISERSTELRANGQTVWLNADVLPGPNSRRRPEIPADAFMPLCRQLCPWAMLSLGWCVGVIGPEECYTEEDMIEMRRVCVKHRVPGAAVVFATNLRMSERSLPALSKLLQQVPGSQMLFWTGTGETPVPSSMCESVQLQLGATGAGHRVGFDAAVASTCWQLSQAQVIDFSFFASRWSRWLCCPIIPMTKSVNEKKPLVDESSGSVPPPPVEAVLTAALLSAPTPQTLHAHAASGGADEVQGGEVPKE